MQVLLVTRHTHLFIYFIKCLFICILPFTQRLRYNVPRIRKQSRAACDRRWRYGMRPRLEGWRGRSCLRTSRADDRVRCYGIYHGMRDAPRRRFSLDLCLPGERGVPADIVMQEKMSLNLNYCKLNILISKCSTWRHCMCVCVYAHSRVCGEGGGSRRQRHVVCGFVIFLFFMPWPSL